MENRMILDPEQLVKRSSDIISSEVDGEIVMMSVEQGKYFGIDTIGGEIWKKLEKPKTIRDICDELNQEYEADLATIQEDVNLFMKDLIDHNIIEIV